MLGEYLKTKRREAKLSLGEIVDLTCIKKGYLAAIEENEYEKIPAEVFLKGYLKDYAETLLLNPTEGLEIYEKEKREREGPVHTPEIEVRQRDKYYIKYITPILGVIFIISIITMLLNPLHQDNTASIEEEGNGVFSYVPEALKPKDANALQVRTLEIEPIEKTTISLSIDGAESEKHRLVPGKTQAWTAYKSFNIKIDQGGGLKIILNGKGLNSPEVQDQVISFQFRDGG